MESRFLNLTETAKVLGVSKSSVCLAVKAGRIPAVRISCYPLVPRAWVDEQEAKALASVKQEGAVV